jgi:hypothetical protein
VSSLCFSASGDLLVAGCCDRNGKWGVHLADIGGVAKRVAIRVGVSLKFGKVLGHEDLSLGRVSMLAFSPEGDRLIAVCGSAGNSVRVWTRRSGHAKKEWADFSTNLCSVSTQPASPFTAVVWGEGGRLVAACGQHLAVWGVGTQHAVIKTRLPEPALSLCVKEGKLYIASKVFEPSNEAQPAEASKVFEPSNEAQPAEGGCWKVVVRSTSVQSTLNGADVAPHYQPLNLLGDTDERQIIVAQEPKGVTLSCCANAERVLLSFTAGESHPRAYLHTVATIANEKPAKQVGVVRCCFPCLNRGGPASEREAAPPQGSEGFALRGKEPKACVDDLRVVVGEVSWVGHHRGIL